MYSQEDIRKFANDCLSSYLKHQTVPLSFNEFWATAFNTLYSNPKRFNIDRIEDKTLIKIAPSTKEMLAIVNAHSKEFEDISKNAPSEKKDFLISQLCKELIKPKLEFEYTPPRVVVEYDGKKVDTPIWFNTTMDGCNVRLGYDNGDSALPSAIELGDKTVHMMLGGATGAGKSVALNTVICNLLLEYAPWELDLFLGDFKIVELSRYANRMQTPHVKIVAATGSTEFIMSLYNELIREMNDRQNLFTKVGVQKLADFRKKFGMVMPRCLLIVDEFAQMYENIKASAEKGNDSAAEDKKAVDAALSGIARLGRSMGIHMCLSSQQLDNLDASVANQFGAGATLKAPPGVSTSLIGNDAGSTIRGKGKGYYNTNKAEKKYEDNVLVRVPFLNSEQSEEDAAAGKLTNLHEILKICVDYAELYKFNKGLVFYDETAPIPAQMYVEAVQWCKDQLVRKSQSTELDDVIFNKQCIAYLPMGPEIKLSDDPVVPLVINADKNNSIVLHGTDPAERSYIANLLATSIRNMYGNVTTYVINGSEAIVLGCGLDKLPGVIMKNRPIIPGDLLSKITNRNILIELQARFDDVITEAGHDFSQPPEWEQNAAWEYFSETNRSYRDANLPVSKLEEYATYVRDNNSFECIPEDIQGDRLIAVKNIINAYNKYFITYHNMIKKGKLTPKSFGLIVVWLAGVDKFTNINDSEVKGVIKYIMENAPLVNVLPIAMANTWGKVGGLFENTNFIIERCDKTFFMDIGLPKAVNCNDRSFQIHDRLMKQRFIVSKYSALEV